MSSYRYRKSHSGDKTVVRSSYLHNGISYNGKMSFLCWIGAQMISLPRLFNGGIMLIHQTYRRAETWHYLGWYNIWTKLLFIFLFIYDIVIDIRWPVRTIIELGVCPHSQNLQDSYSMALFHDASLTCSCLPWNLQGCLITLGVKCRHNVHAILPLP